MALLICGECLLEQTVHYGYLKVYIVCQRSFVFLGVLMMHITNKSVYAQETAYLVPTFIIIHAILLAIAHESPAYLMFNLNVNGAIKSLSWYRGSTNLNVEIRELRKDTEAKRIDPENYKYILYNKVVVKGILLLVGLTFFQVFSGYYLFLFYHLEVLGRYESVAINQYMDVLLFGLTLFISNLISNWIHFDLRFGVKKPLIISGTLVSLNLMLLLGYCISYDLRWHKVSKHLIEKRILYV